MLKYRFICRYNDGTQFRQNANDVSVVDPKRSAFFDIVQENLATFSLVGNEQVFSVDLHNGHFEVNGTTIWLHDQGLSLENRRLIFWRQHTHKVNAGGQETDHSVRYLLGWQANRSDTGENVQAVMGVD